MILSRRVSYMASLILGGSLEAGNSGGWKSHLAAEAGAEVSRDEVVS